MITSVFIRFAYVIIGEVCLGLHGGLGPVTGQNQSLIELGENHGP